MIETTLRPAFQRFIAYAGNRIETEAEASGPPPRTLRAFGRWCLAGAWPVIIAATMFSVLAGASEVFSMYLLGPEYPGCVTGRNPPGIDDHHPYARGAPGSTRNFTGDCFLK